MNFEDMIKVSYAWFGPQGPLWNTELPHIMNYARVSNKIRTESSYYWCDDIWDKLFKDKKENYILYPSSQLTEKDIFIYPFGLSWRVQFNNYFYGNTGLLEYAHTDGNVIHHVRCNKGFFLIDLAVEAFFHEDQIACMHNYFNSVHHIPLNKIIYLTGCMNAHELYAEFRARRNLADIPGNKLSIICYPSSQTIYSRQLRDGDLIEPEYNPDKIPQKLFLCWNRRFRGHRTMLALALDKAGLVDRSYYSMGQVDPEMTDVKFEHTIDLFSYPELEITQDDAGRFCNKLPLKIDEETDNVKMCRDDNNVARDFYQNSLVSLVTETNYNLSQVTLTEKAFKPAKEKHPFILIGASGSLKSMKNLGYKTFSEFWDEGYDNTKNDRLRMKSIVEICKYIGSWDESKIREFRHKVKPILEHNFNLFKSMPSDDVSERIANVVRSNI